MLLIPDTCGVSSMPPDHVGRKHTGVALTALFAELKVGCTHTFFPLEDVGEAQRFC